MAILPPTTTRAVNGRGFPMDDGDESTDPAPDAASPWPAPESARPDTGAIPRYGPAQNKPSVPAVRPATPPPSPYWEPAPPRPSLHTEPQARSVNGLAIASMVLGVVSFLMPFLGLVSFLAVVLGVVARTQITRSRGESGDGFAVAGITLGLVSFFYYLIVFRGVFLYSWFW
jgi:hypothetical protein